jgi:hypothetical protein
MLARERFGTQGALKGAFCCVSASVRFQIIGPSEGFIAVRIVTSIVIVGFDECR